MRKVHDPGLAAVFSVILPGLGQVYNGAFGRAILMFGSWIWPWPLMADAVWKYAKDKNSSDVLTSSHAQFPWFLVVLLAVVAFISRIGAAADAYNTASEQEETDIR